MADEKERMEREEPEEMQDLSLIHISEPTRH